jgi:hypothetical protein
MQTISVTGVPWLEPGESRQYGVEALTAKILCKRHNEALSPLDTHARQFARAWTSAINHASRPSRSERSEHFLVSGEAFERWLLKAMIGLFVSKIAAFDRKPATANFRFNLEPLVKALFGEGLQAPKGLYLDPHLGEGTTNSISFAPIQMEGQGNLYGLMVDFHGFHWLLVTDEAGGEDRLSANRGLYRVQMVDLNGPRRTSRIFMTWPARDRQRTAIGFDLAEAQPGPAPNSPDSP